MSRRFVGAGGLGLVLILASLVTPVAILKENRVAAGEAAFLWDLPFGPLPLLWIAAALGAVVLFWLDAGTRRVDAVALAARLALALCLATVALAGAGALAAWDARAGRVTLGTGFWLAAAGAYLVVYDAKRSGAEGRRVGAVSDLLLVASMAVVLVAPAGRSLSLVQEVITTGSRFARELAAHLAITGGSVAGAILIGVPLGILAHRSKKASRTVLSLTSAIQTIPSLALFGLMIAPLAALANALPALRAIGIRGVGNAPAVIALILYGLLPIARNTLVGLRQVDSAVVDAARGMGMSRRQRFRRVELPLALPVLLTGVRITAVQTVGNATVAALVGADGLGNFVFQGLGQASPDLIVAGVLPIIAMAIVVDRVMERVVATMSRPKRPAY